MSSTNESEEKLEAPGARSGTGTLSITFGLLGALIAYGIMRMADTQWFDPLAFRVGVGAAAVLGALSAWGVQALGRVSVMRYPRWLLIPIAGAIVGMIVQAVPLRTPVEYYVVVSGLTKAEPITWILVGIPLGGLPAIVVTFLLHLCLSVTTRGQAPALDARERMIVPAVGTCLVLAASALWMSSSAETPIVILIAVLAFASLVEVVIRDFIRARWLTRAFRGDGPFLVVPMNEVQWSGDLPAFVGGAAGGAAIVRVLGEASYRSAARHPVAATSDMEHEALRPLSRRRLIAASFVGAAAFIGGAFALVSFLAAIY